MRLLIAGLIYAGLLFWAYKIKPEVFRKPDFRRILPATRDALRIVAKGSASFLWGLGYFLLLGGVVLVFVAALGWSLYDLANEFWSNPTGRRDLILIIAGVLFWSKLDKLERLLKSVGK